MNILLARTVVVLCLVGIPTGSFSRVLSVAKMCWQVYGKLFHKIWNLKGSPICKFWDRTQRMLKAYREGVVFDDEVFKQQLYKSRRRVQVHHERNELIN